MDTINKRLEQKAFYDQWSPVMYPVCLKYTRTREDAEDALQNGFIKVFLNLNSFRGDGAFEGWMNHIFRNESIMLFRKYKAFSEVQDTEFNRSETGLINLYCYDLEKLVQGLAPRYREVFTLFFAGYSHAEIGQMLGISVSCSKSQCCRARKILMKKAA